ncbi:MAG: putative quorum-sensing-regulated virulence factor, partial [Acidobacteriaceae bacterium]
TDVIGCSILLRALIDHFMPALWNDLWKLSEAARIPDTMYFGKYKGTSIEEIPLDYCQWMLKQPDIDPYLRTAMERRLASGMAAVPSAPGAMSIETPAAS